MTEYAPKITKVLAAYELHPAQVRSIVPCEGGLSGSEAWKVEGSAASYCLKLMPPDFSVNRLLAAHHAANHRRQLGMTYLAGYLPTTAGQTYVESDGRLWELQNWIEGTPPAVPYTALQKKAMFQAIAEFHERHESPPRQSDVSPGIQSRIQLCEKWRIMHLRDQFPSLHHFGHPQWKSALEEFLDSFVHYHTRLGLLLLSQEHETFTLEDCIADPRPENFRFDGDQLTGLFDLGSMRWDNIALDLARLASEVSHDGEVDWNFAFQAVKTVRPLTPSEERLAEVFDVANVLLTGLNWVQWLAIDGISFANCDHVSSRLNHLTDRLEKIEKHPTWKLQTNEVKPADVSDITDIGEVALNNAFADTDFRLLEMRIPHLRTHLFFRRWLLTAIQVLTSLFLGIEHSHEAFCPHRSHAASVSPSDHDHGPRFGWRSVQRHRRLRRLWWWPK